MLKRKTSKAVYKITIKIFFYESIKFVQSVLFIQSTARQSLASRSLSFSLNIISSAAPLSGLSKSLLGANEA